jgi:HSP20 family protein
MAEQGKTLKRSEKGKEIQRPVSRALSPFDEIEQMMDRMFGFLPAAYPRPFAASRWPIRAEWEPQTPRVDVVDREDSVLVRAELPGVKKEDLDVSVRDNAVSIRAISAWEEKEE